MQGLGRGYEMAEMDGVERASHHPQPLDDEIHAPSQPNKGALGPDNSPQGRKIFRLTEGPIGKAQRPDASFLGLERRLIGKPIFIGKALD